MSRTEPPDREALSFQCSTRTYSALPRWLKLSEPTCRLHAASQKASLETMTLCSRNIIIIAKKSNSYLSTFLDPHPDSPIVLSAQPEAPADADLVQSPEVQVQPDFREPLRCSNRCQQAARATHRREDTRVADAVAAGPCRACVHRREPSGRASDDQECWRGRECGKQLSARTAHTPWQRVV